MSELIEQLCRQLRLPHIAEGYENIPFTSPEEFVLNLLLRNAMDGSKLKPSGILKRLDSWIIKCWKPINGIKRLIYHGI